MCKGELVCSPFLCFLFRANTQVCPNDFITLEFPSNKAILTNAHIPIFALSNHE